MPDVRRQRAPRLAGLLGLLGLGRKPLPRVGCVRSVNAMGGVNTLMLALRESRSCQIHWTATAIHQMYLFDRGAAVRFGQPIYTAVPLPEAAEGLVTRTASWPAAVQQVVDQSDLIVMWGYEMADGLERVDFQGKPVLLQAFGSCQWTRELVAALLPFATHHMAISRPAADTFPPELRPRVRVIHPGVQLARCVPTRSRDEVRAEWGLGREDRALGYLGRMSPEKNPLAIAQAVAALDGRWHGIYVGDGWNLAEIREQAARLAGERVRFFPAVEHVGDVLGAFDAFMLASPAEGFALALCEAWAAGLPTIATLTGAVPELESEHGQLVIPVPVEAGPVELAAAVRHSQTAAARPVVDNARRLVFRDLQDKNFGETFARYVHEILREYPARDPSSS
jgi:hypothetical protein